MKEKIRVLLIAGLWLLLSGALWLLPEEEISLSERRPLAKKPELTVSGLINGRYMEEFEDWSLDQFPLRDGFRTVKSLFHSHVLGHRDNNGIYIAQDMAAVQEYPLDPASLEHAAKRFDSLYENYLTNCRVYFAVVPDKGQYLAGESGQLSLDMGQMQTFFSGRLPWAAHIDLEDTLTHASYYRTDTHWRQEALLDTADRLCQAMGAKSPEKEDYTLTAVEKPFYGVYYGQAALPMAPDTMYYLQSEMLRQCRVYDHETGEHLDIYNMDMLESRDLYDLFLSGAKSLLTIENPNSLSDRELILFRDSFGSAIAPLLVQEYARVTLVDIRYLHSSMLPRYIDFQDQDVLLLYSTLVLNNSETIK